jgi:hypothetical protein
VNVGFPYVIEVVVSVAVLWANLAYLFVTSTLLIKRFQGWPRKGGAGLPHLFSLGRWGVPVNVLAVLWGVFTVVNIGWPRADPENAGSYYSLAPLLATAGLLLTGAAYYALVQRHKPRGLEEPAR